MLYDARQIANWFVTRAQRDGRTLSIMSLLKLIYIAHGWFLEVRNAPLFSNRIEAWKYGPVIPDVYNAFRDQGITAQNTVHVAPQVAFAPNDEQFLDQVWSRYGRLSPFRLSDMTHVPGGPWDIATRTSGYYAPISNQLIAAHYNELRNNSNIDGRNVG